MGLTRFPHGLSSFGIPLFGGEPLGIGTGDIYYLVTAKTSSDKYYLLLQSRGISDADIFTNLQTAHNAMTADQGDTLVVMPGLQTQTATCNWSKDRTHIFGAGGPNIALTRKGRPNCAIYTDTAGVDYTIDVSGDNCQFYNVLFQNGDGTSAGATTANLSACRIAGYGNYFGNCAFRGINTAAQIGDTTGLLSSLEISTGAGELIFDRCVIGHNNFGGTRTQKGGHLLFGQVTSDTPSPSQGIFRECFFLNRTEAANSGAVYVAYYLATDRIWYYDNCMFSNWSPNWVTNSTAAFNFANLTGMQTTQHLLHHCCAVGYTYWVTNNFTGPSGSAVQSDGHLCSVGGGLMIAPSGTKGS